MENLKNTLLKKIESKSIEQTPRWRFVLHGILGIIAGIILFIVTIFVVQLLLLIAHEYTVSHAVGIVPSQYGFAGTLSFWMLVIIGIGISIGFYNWLRNHAHLYRYKNLYTVIAVLSLIAGFAIGIQLFDQSMQFARIGERPIPGIHQLDRAVRPPRPTGLVSGTIVMIRGTLIAIQTRDQDTFYVQVPPFEQIQNDFEIGDRVTVFGMIHGDQIDAQQIVKQ